MSAAKRTVKCMALEDLRDERKLSALFPHLDLTEEVSERLDVKRYLSNLVENVDHLVELMLATDSYIVGQRAAGFFLPSACSDTTPWRIACSGSSYYRRALLEWLVGKGFEAAVYQHKGSDVLCGRMRKPEGHCDSNASAYWTVDLLNECGYRPPQVAMAEDASAFRCYITGYEAVSLASPTTRMSETMLSVTSMSDSTAVYDILAGAKLRHVSFKHYRKAMGRSKVRSLSSPSCTTVSVDYTGSLKQTLEHLSELEKSVDRLCSWTESPNDVVVDPPDSEDEEDCEEGYSNTLKSKAVTKLSLLARYDIITKERRVSKGWKARDKYRIERPDSGLSGHEKQWVGSGSAVELNSVELELICHLDGLKL